MPNQRTATPKKKKNKSRSKKINLTLIYAGLIFASLVVILPFLIIVITSFKTKSDAMSDAFTIIGAKDGFSIQGYKEVFAYVDSNGVPLILTGFLNTMLVSVVPTVVSLFFSALAAFAFAKIKFKLSKTFFNILIFTIIHDYLI